MKLRNILLAAASLVFTAGAAAQDRPAPADTSRNRHLLFIATPGGGGADGQSGIVVLDADRGYRFVKRISYDLPAARMPGPQITGIAASVPENKLYVAVVGSMLAFDLTTDKIAWEFKGGEGAGRDNTRWGGNQRLLRAPLYDAGRPGAFGCLRL